MKEIWKDIKGWNGLYQISNTGKVRRVFKNKTRELKRYYENWWIQRCVFENTRKI